MYPRKSGRFRLSLTAIAVASALALAACGSDDGDDGGDGGSSGSGGGVPVGSDLSVYKEALADMEPITIKFGGQTQGPGNPGPDAYQAWTDRVSELSGGKINFEIDHAGAKVPLPQMADALQQGRIDMGMYIPSYQPDKWPVSNLATAMSMWANPAPVAGRLAAFAAEAEFGFAWEPLAKEAEAAGLKPLYPLFAPGHDTRLMCNKGEPTSLDYLKGKQIRVVDKTQAALMTELGATPVSLTTTELFTGLQRGVVDCAINALGTVAPFGYEQVTNSWVTGPDAGTDFIDTPSGWGISQKLWDQLPLAAQQLIWDTQQEMVAGQVKASFQGYLDGINAIKSVNGTFPTYEDDVVAKIKEFDEKNAKDVAKRIEDAGLADDGTEVVEEYKALYEKWWDIVTGELGVPGDLKWGDYSQSFNDDVDWDAYAKKFYEEILVDHRPGS